MLKFVFKYLIIVVSFALATISCTKDVDFNQANDILLTPVFESDLAYINVTANKFLVEGQEVVNLKDSVNIDFFQDEFIVDYLVKAEFMLETTNTINRAFTVQIDMFDDFNQLQHTFSFFSSASPNNSEVVTEHVEIFEGNTLVALKNTTKLVFTLTIQTGEQINESTPGRIILKSKGTFYLNIDG